MQARYRARQAGKMTQMLAYLDAEPTCFLLMENRQKAEALRQRLPPWDARKSRIGTREDYELYIKRYGKN